MKPYLLNLHERPLTLVKFNYDGDMFLTCAKDGEVNLMRTDTCERVGTYNPKGEKPGAVYAVDVTLDSQFVVIAGADGRLIFFAFNTGEEVAVLNHGGIMKYVEFNLKPGSQHYVCTCNDKFKSASEGTIPNRIMIWKWYDGENEQPRLSRCLSIDEHLPMKATKVKWGAYDETLVSIFEEGTVIIWDCESGKQLKVVMAHHGPVTGFNFSEDRMLMITSSKDQTAKLWAMDEAEPELIKTYKTDRPLNDAAISPLYGDENQPKYHVLLGGGQDAKDVTTSAASSGKFEAMIWHMVYEEEIGTIKGHFGPMNTLAWFRDGRGFVSGGEDGYVRVHHFDNDYFTKKPFE
jgi:translation initiation factor 3 subunit I